MQLVHHPVSGEPEVLADDIEFANTWLSRARGLMFRSSFPQGAALIFEFDSNRSRSIHMLFVAFPIDALWLDDEEVTRVARLRSWVGLARGRGDTIIECPAGACDEVKVGDRVTLSASD